MSGYLWCVICGLGKESCVARAPDDEARHDVYYRVNSATANRPLRADVERRERERDGQVFTEDVMPRVDGKAFRCDCGCNVFRRPAGEWCVLVCNSCSLRWIGEP